IYTFGSGDFGVYDTNTNLYTAQVPAEDPAAAAGAIDPATHAVFVLDGKMATLDLYAWGAAGLPPPGVSLGGRLPAATSGLGGGSLDSGGSAGTSGGSGTSSTGSSSFGSGSTGSSSFSGGSSGTNSTSGTGGSFGSGSTASPGGSGSGGSAGSSPAGANGSSP